MPFMKKSQPEHTAPPAENLSQLRAEFRHQLWKTIFLFFVGTVVIAAASVAWFVSNSRVKSATAPVSAGFETIKLATKGVRQTAESTLLNLEEGETLLHDGDAYYYTEDGTIALRLSEDNIVVSPGASGTVTFYVIPTRDGAMSLTLYLGLAGYAENNNSAERINDPTLDALLSGHILLFENKDENGHYSGWLGTGNTINVTLPENAKKDVPEEVSVHWIWPLRYENMRSDLYVNESQAETEKFLMFLDTQAQKTSMTTISNGYSYSQIYLTSEKDLTTVASRSKAYNLADEYIGTNAQYLYLAIQTSAVPTETN